MKTYNKVFQVKRANKFSYSLLEAWKSGFMAAKLYERKLLLYNDLLAQKYRYLTEKSYFDAD